MSVIKFLYKRLTTKEDRKTKGKKMQEVNLDPKTNSRRVETMKAVHKGGGRYRVFVKAWSTDFSTEQRYITKTTFSKDEVIDYFNLKMYHPFMKVAGRTTESF